MPVFAYFKYRSSPNDNSTNDDSESDVFNSSVVNLPLSSQKTSLFPQKESSANPAIGSLQKTPTPSQTDSGSLISPVLSKKGNYSVKRDRSKQSGNPPATPSSEKSIPSPESVFQRSLLCVTPIKDRKKKPAKVAKQQSDTPPHFWSLDMPPTP